MIKKGDILYCHTDLYYKWESDLIAFKSGKNYIVDDVHDINGEKPFISLKTEDDSTYLIGIAENGICKSMNNFYTIDKHREKKLSKLGI